MMLTTKDVAVRLNVAIRTVQTGVANGDIQAFQIGRVVRIDETALNEFILLGCRTNKKIAPPGGSPTPIRRANKLGGLLGRPSTRTQKRKSKSSDPNRIPSNDDLAALK